MLRRSRWTKLLTAATLAVCAAPLAAQIQVFRERIPLGTEQYRIQPGKQTFYLMVSSASPLFDGLHQTGSSQAPLAAKNGVPLRLYPSRLVFRVTASSREKLAGADPFNVESDVDLNDYLLRLGFRLKIFRGLQVRNLEPAAVEQIGMPADVQYDERIYRVSFDVGEVPIDRRVVLEVLGPAGDRLGKFHLDLY